MWVGLQPSKNSGCPLYSEKKVTPFHLKIEGKELEYSSSVKYLGVLLDSKLTWKLHISTKLANAKRLLNMALTAVRANWGPNP